MPIVQGTEIKSIAHHIELLQKNPALGRQTLGAEATWNGNLSSRVVPNDVIQGSGGECLYAEDLLEVLACCVAYDVLGHAQHQAVPVTGVKVSVSGDIDFAGSLGLPGPAGFKAIRVDLELATDAAGKRVDKLVTTARQASVVGQSLSAVPQYWAVTRVEEVAA